MFWALANDLLQRTISCNKREQRKSIRLLLQNLPVQRSGSVLDFGCGTALFAPIFIKLGFKYCGYDIDKTFIAYDKMICRRGTFFSSIEDLDKEPPFDFIIANCCFHHIEDSQFEGELDSIKRLLSARGIFVVIDIIKPDNDRHFLRRLFKNLERGEHIRPVIEYQKLIERHFSIIDLKKQRLHIFSVKYIPIHNDTVIFICKKGSI